ncbi:uncharacterized protein E0L32_003280 [Thyridium curvatum]|uniref:Transcription initiation factor TFIID subunit 2 n=1 Tax=Thyridium curvatum TaxID=1093900 RepID=A0A507B4H5_9PEZI|nr:uncharacterized protein E0L32_003280 [Thyridium curvatum]TPX17162.1 hypothetical protein E0L32_003280 [Thyridium curvatum]
MPGTVDEPSLEAHEPSPLEERGSVQKFLVINQEVSVEVDFQQRSISGETRLRIFCLDRDDQPEEVALDARQFEIALDRITVNGKKPASVTYRDPYEALDVPKEYDLTPAHHTVLRERMRSLLPRPRKDLALENRESVGCSPADGALRISLREASSLQSQGSSGPRIRVLNNAFIDREGVYEIVIPFHASHIRDGLQFVGVEDYDARYPHVYTRHSYEPGIASCIFPCVDDPGMRCTWKIHVKCPRTLADALRQPLASQPTSKNSSRPPKPRSSRDVAMTEEDKLLDMTVVCSGVLIGEKVDEDDDTKKIMSFDITEHPAAPQHVGFAVGPFEHVDLFSEFRSEEDDEKLGASALKIHGYCLPGREDEVRNSCEALAAAADEFAMTYGRYPYDSYKVCFVEDMVADTVPLLSFSLCSTRLLFPEGIIDTEIDVTRTLVHSLACQYFGVYIVPNQRTDIWLTVGISYYMTDLFLARLCGNNDYRFRIKTMADRLLKDDIKRPSLHDLGTFLYLGDSQMEFMALKAPLVLFILDKRMTKAAGSAGASLARAISRIISKANTSVYGDIKNEIISSESFQKLCDRTASSQSSKLENFWAQFVQGAGLPYLEIKQRFNKKRLCVEVTIHEKQDTERKSRPLQKDTFFRELLEKRQRVPVQNIPLLFTGSMTIRIHEANGTPYEHIVDIREDAGRGVKFDIPYNTKYKRLKRNKKNKERATAAALADPSGENQEDAIVFSLGDRLDTPEEMLAWKLADWSETDEKAMENDSYEWIRIDSDFEWIFDGKANFSPWMYTSQLQQDRDVAAQQDTLVYLSRIQAHPIAATVLTRTLYDDRYFHGLRTMAADILSRQCWKNSADPDVDFRGLDQLIRVFRTFFCYPDSNTPRPNNFADKRQYMVQLAIPKAISKVQFEDKHPREAQRFLLEQLQFNNNNNNIYSDHFYVASLLEALATSLTSSHSAPKKQAEMSFSFDSDGEGELEIEDDETMVDTEGKQLLDQALEEIERYRRMDEWTASYHNIWTIAALRCKKTLMKAGVIPTSPLDFMQYLHDGTLDLVRITAFEALIELGLILKPAVLGLLLSVMTTSSSPFMRDSLFKLFCQGLASIAFGEAGEPSQPERQAPPEDGALVVQQADSIIEHKKADVARKADIMVSAAALREQVKDNKQFRAAMWKAVNSPVIGCVEKRNLLELCDVLFEGESNFVVTVTHPTMWKVECVGTAPRLILNFKAVPRPLREAPPPPPPAAPAAALPPAPVVEARPSVMSPPPPSEPKKPAGNRIKLQSSRSSLGALPQASPAPTAARTALPSSASAPAIDSISVQPAQRAALPTSRPAPPPSVGLSAAAPPSSATADITARPPKAATSSSSNKRKADDAHAESKRPRKLVKLQLPPGYQRNLPENTRRWIESSSVSPSPRASSVHSSDSIRAAGPASLAARSGPSSMSPSASGGANAARSPSVGAGAPKPARRPLPTGAPPTAGPASNGSVAAAAPAAHPAPPPSASPPAETPKPKTLLKIKFKPKAPKP